MGEKSKILIIGGTGNIGKFIVEASAKLGHPTFPLVRKTTVSDPVQGQLIQTFKDLGVNIVHGDFNDHESLLKAIKQVDVVISSVSPSQILDQHKIVAAIKEAGNIKRYLPSEFGNDVDRSINAVGPAKSMFTEKAGFRRSIEAEGVPYTYVTSDCFSGYFLPTLSQPGATCYLPTKPGTSPPRDKVVIAGDGNAKVRNDGLFRTRNETLHWLAPVFNDEHDIATYTTKSVDDPRTLNKILYIKPTKNIYSINEHVALWENKLGKTLEKEYIPEEQLLKNIQEASVPLNLFLSLHHSIFVKGDQTNFEIKPAFGVEASELYPEVKYTTVEKILTRFV